MALLRKSVDALGEVIRRPSYREYLWEKLGQKLGIIPKAVEPILSLGGRTPSPDGARPASTEGRVRDRLFHKSPYDGFDPRPHPRDLQGWGSDAPILTHAIRIVRPSRICEVGSWKGRSAINMARTVRDLNLTTEIICVDTWLGSPEHWLKLNPESFSSLRISNGMPQIYYTFLANVLRSGAANIITPFPTTSENAAVVFEKMGVRFDIVYIDAAHEYEPAKRDIKAYYDLLEDDGLLIGDDYLTWPGVTKAADEFSLERNVRILSTRGKFIIPKGEKYASVVLA